MWASAGFRRNLGTYDLLQPIVLWIQRSGFKQEEGTEERRQGLSGGWGGGDYEFEREHGFRTGWVHIRKAFCKSLLFCRPCRTALILNSGYLVGQLSFHKGRKWHNMSSLVAFFLNIVYISSHLRIYGQ